MQPPEPVHHEGQLIGRAGELLRLKRFLSRGGSPRLVIGGPAGIGKSALLDVAAAEARRQGYHVLRAASSPAETYIPYATLHQLLQPTLGRLGLLSQPQRAAVETAFGLATSEVPPEVLFIGLGTLRLLASPGETTVAVIDDAHWMDSASRSVLEFVWRRLDQEPVRMLAATREDAVRTTAGDFVELRPLTEEHARALAVRSGTGLSGERLRRVLDLAAGNPLALRELPQAMPSEPTAAPGDDLPLVTRLEMAFTDRLRLIDPAAYDILLAASLNDSGLTADALAAATHLLGSPARLGDLDEAERAGVVTRTGGRLRFTHPLIASALVREAGPEHVARMHRSLAATTRDPYAAVWHEAHATTRPDDQVADALERAADLAQARGATRAARAAMIRAAALSVDELQRGRRLVEAAELAFELGEPEAVGRLMEEARALGLDEPSAARLAFLEGRFDDGVSDPLQAVDRQLARAEAALQLGGQELAASLLDGASRACYIGALDDRARVRAVLTLTDRLRLAPDDGRVLLIRANLSDIDTELFTCFATAALAPGEPGDECRRALAALVAGDWDKGHLFAVRACQGLRQQGRLGLLTQALALRALSALFLGHWEDVAGAAGQSEELARETEQAQWGACATVTRAGLAGLQGQSSIAHRLADQVDETAVLSGNAALLDNVRMMRGFAQLAEERYAEAYQTLISRLDGPVGTTHKGQSRWAIDFLAEAAAGAGRAVEARTRLAAHLAADGRVRAPAQERAVALARAVLAPDDNAEGAYRAAGAAALGATAWFRGRLDLNYGMWLRRQRRGSEARDLLQPCITIFDHLGAVAWADKARRELAAIGQRTTGGSGVALTAQELQIVRLAAEGLTNKEIGRRLRVSHRTVGTHLYKAFDKLGVRTRSQLHRFLPEKA